ncbi:unnamed protein product [Angiostrongylus costaricensis]|uniref:Inositol-phosphate phosphatase n=1 Tax=Angiostrongylus costaricensis TaxID=334426 RepID=A0A0R3PNC2_ANGCS|nr:unnamed protein product [Angiostrongylus costaricensis]
MNIMMVAQGACDAMVEYGLHAWDIAAAAVIVSEAGGCVIDPTGRPFIWCLPCLLFIASLY